MKKWQKITLFSALGLLLGGSIAGGAWASKQAVEQGEAEIAEVAEEEKTSWLKDKYQTFIVPLFASVSISSLATMAITIGLTVIKNKQLDEKVLEIKREAEENRRKAEEKLAEATEILGCVRKIYEIGMSNKEQITHAVQVVDENARQVSKIEDLTKIVSLSAQIAIKQAQQSANSVKSGVAEELSEIQTLIKSL